MKKYNTPHRSRVIKTRLTEEEFAEFSERVSLCKMSQAEFIRQAFTKSRIRRVFRASFPLQNEPSRVYPASPNQIKHTPGHYCFPGQ